MSKKGFSLNKIFQRRGTQSLFKGVRITSQVVWNLFLIFIILGTMLVFFVGGAGAGYFASLVKDEPIRSYEDLQRDIYDYEEATEIYFANDIKLGDLPSPLERREVSLENISPHVINAVIATEDEYFFEHDGIVPKALLRALYQDFSNAAMQTGGSTLTQQLIKNQVLTSDVTHDRKASEILLALRLEQFFDKEEILEAYLNVVPYGRNSSGTQIAGVQAAAQGIFGVDAKDLNIAQSAFIAGLPQSPFAYTPFTSRIDGEAQVKENMDAGLNRMRTVLNRMLTEGYITEQEHREALAYDIIENLIPPQRSGLEDYPYITDEVRRRSIDILAKVMMDEDNIDLDEIEDPGQRSLVRSRYREEATRTLHRNGYRIYTTIDKDIYDVQQKVVEEFNLFANDRTETVINEHGEEVERIRPEQVGATLIDNKTGRIISFIGGRDYQLEQLNHATQADRQTGSTMKPLLTFGVGFEVGAFQPGFITPDIPYNYPGNEAKPVPNFDNNYLGLITAREAMARSRNVPAVREFEKIPHDIARQTLINYGFEKYFIGNEPYPATTLGTIDMTVEANTSAFSTFGNYGKRYEPYMIERIESSSGQIIFQHETNEIEIFSEQTSYLMIDMMRDVLRSPGTAAGLPGYLQVSADWAGKTGTSNNIRDSWFVGFNPNISMGIWLGYAYGNIPQRIHGYSYGQRTQMLWARLINAAYEIDPELIGPSSRFESPSGIVRQSICGISGKLPSDLCREAGLVTTDLFNSRFVPTEVDDSLTRVNYVRVDGDLYKALEATPLEFTNEGVSVKEEYFDFGEDSDFSRFIPDKWDMIIPDKEAPDNGKTPDSLKSLSATDSSISWSEHHEGDVIGYRVYYSPEVGVEFTLVNSVKWDEDYEYTGRSGAYYVTAIDVAGRESYPSEEAIIGEYIDPIEEQKKKEEERKRQEEEERKRKEEEEEEKRNEEDDDDGNGNENGDEHDRPGRDRGRY
ncbi:transglycosylase domain-containing protein [Evansella sp. AB-rgal1]|uniref:transglycosylase domain-containing protein n=1 Tax=Evansella sp. AB-rgal1 TaxID=3242696 RepID=UPI00359E23D2